MWHALYSGGGAASFNWGWSETTPVPGDYNGYGKTDAAVYYQPMGDWYIRNSSGGNTSVHWGWDETFPP
jgi:hypothetical protein